MNDDNNKNKKKEQSDEELLKNVTGSEYKYGFVSDIDTHVIPVGLNEDVVRYISKVKGEPEWLLDFRLKAPLEDDDDASLGASRHPGNRLPGDKLLCRSEGQGRAEINGRGRP